MNRNELCQLAVREMESVYRLADRLSRGSGACAESLVEETYRLALHVPQRVPLHEKAVRLWLFSVLHMVLHSRLPEDADDALNDDHTVRASPDAAGTILSWYRLSSDDWARVDARLERAIDELPQRHRIVFLLWSCEGLSTRQIASIVQAPEPIVRGRLLRATMAIATQLGEAATGWLGEPAAEIAAVPVSV